MQCKSYSDFMTEYENFSSILFNYRSKNEKFYDLNFHPQRRIKEPEIPSDKFDFQVEWLRIDEVYKAPLFDKDLICSDFVQQGHLGNCSFISAISRIARDPKLIPDLFDQTADCILGPVPNSINIECGAVVIFFHAFGRETPVLIDTLIPFHKNTHVPFFSRPSNRKVSPWFCLVEKAYAKLQGSYSNITGVHFTNVIYNLFGYDKFFLFFSDLKKKPSKKTPFGKIVKYMKQGAVMDTAISLEEINLTKEQLKNVGLIPNHSYLIEKAISYKGMNFLHLRNPWGTFEWKGDWSNKSPLWTEDIKQGLKIKNPFEKGTFWMIENDYLKYFYGIQVSKPIPPNWHSKSFTVEMWCGESDGIHPNSPRANLHHLPNFVFQVAQKVPDTEKVKIYFLIERRPYLQNGVELINEKPSTYCLLLVNSNGLRLMHDVYIQSKRTVIQINEEIAGLKYQLKQNNQKLTIALQRMTKCDFEEECSIRISCNYKFKLYNIDEPDNFIPDNEAGVVIFNNMSLVHTLARTQNFKPKKKNNAIQKDDQHIDNPDSDDNHNNNIDDDEINELKEKIENLKKEIDEIQKKINAPLDKTIKLNSELKVMVNDVLTNEYDDQKLTIMVDQIEKKRNELEKLEATVNSFLKGMNNKIEEIESTNKIIEELRIAKNNKSKIKNVNSDEHANNRKNKHKKVLIPKPKLIPVNE